MLVNYDMTVFVRGVDATTVGARNGGQPRHGRWTLGRCVVRGTWIHVGYFRARVYDNVFTTAALR